MTDELMSPHTLILEYLQRQSDGVMYTVAWWRLSIGVCKNGSIDICVLFKPCELDADRSTGRKKMPGRGARCVGLSGSSQRDRTERSRPARSSAKKKRRPPDTREPAIE